MPPSASTRRSGAPMVVDGRTLVTTVSASALPSTRTTAPTWASCCATPTPRCTRRRIAAATTSSCSHPAWTERLKERIAIESSLRTALQSRQLDVHYQPIVDIETQRVVALEALLRWKHPNHGYVRPERFVTIAEEAGLIVPIGDFVLQRAIEDMVRWRQARRQAGAGRHQRVGRAAAALEPGRVHLAPHQGVRVRARDAADRAHRERGVRAARGTLTRGEPGCGRQAARARRAHRHRRLRHRLLEPVVPEALARGHAEDRPQLRARSGHRHERPGDRERHHRHGAPTCTSRWSPKASRAGRSSRSCASSAAAMRRGTCSRARPPRRHACATSPTSPLDLTQRLPVLDRLETTGSGEHACAARLALCTSSRADPAPAAPGRRTCENGPCRPLRNVPARAARPRQQCADAVLMVLPGSFGFNEETAATNTFQQRPAAPDPHAAQAARAEFGQLVAGAAQRGSQRLRGGGFGRPREARCGVPQQLGELSRRRHAGALSAAERQPPRRATAGA